jgi:hypothetical protein
MFDESLPELFRIAMEGKAERDRIAAIDKLGKYGLGPGGRWDQDDVIELTQELGAAVAERVSDREVIEAIREDWVAILRRHSR